MILQHQDCDSNQKDLRIEKNEKMNQWADSSATHQVKVHKSKWSCLSTFDSDAFTGPLFFECGEPFLLTNADDVFLEVELFSVEA